MIGAARQLVVISSISIFLGTAAAAQPSVVSINLCADQLLLNLADPEQILALSWLAADPEEALLAERAAEFPANYGTAEEVIELGPDLVLAGTYSNSFTLDLLRRLGYPVVTIPPATSLEGIAVNLRTIGAAIGQPHRAEAQVAAMFAQIDGIHASRPADGPRVLIVRPGGYTLERDSLGAHLLARTRLVNAAEDVGIDRWGSLSLESLLRVRPDVIVIARYRETDRALANTFLDHPALALVRQTLPTATIHARDWACGIPQSVETLIPLIAQLDGVQTAHSGTELTQ